MEWYHKLYGWFCLSTLSGWGKDPCMPHSYVHVVPPSRGRAIQVVLGVSEVSKYNFESYMFDVKDLTNFWSPVLSRLTYLMISLVYPDLLSRLYKLHYIIYYRFVYPVVGQTLHSCTCPHEFYESRPSKRMLSKYSFAPVKDENHVFGEC